MGIFSRKTKWGNFSGNVNLVSDIKFSDIPKLIAEKNIRQIQLYGFKNPNIRTWETLNQFFKKYPEIGLRILWYEKFDQSFYENLSELRSFAISSYLTKDFSFLKNNLKLKTLGVEETKSKAVDLSFIKEFQDLETLYIDGMKKGLESISKLSKLKTLSLRGVKMDNFGFAENLNNLTELNLLYGSYKDLNTVGKLKKLKNLEISRARQIPDYQFLDSLVDLEKLCFEGMSENEQFAKFKWTEIIKKNSN